MLIVDGEVVDEGVRVDPAGRQRSHDGARQTLSGALSRSIELGLQALRGRLQPGGGKLRRQKLAVALLQRDRRGQDVEPGLPGTLRLQVGQLLALELDRGRNSSLGRLRCLEPPGDVVEG